VIKFIYIFFISISSYAGIGDIAGSGGNQSGRILFQAQNASYHMKFSKSLCFDGANFHAKYKKCLKWKSEEGDRICTKSEIIPIVQPQQARRNVCAKWISEEGDRICLQAKSVPFFQDDVGTVNYYRNNDDGDFIKSENVAVKYCK
jgi:hypothetical protein